MFGMPHGRAYLGELLDGVAYLLVEDAAVGDDNDGAEYRLVVLLQADELVREPCDGVRLPATGGMLDQVPLASAVAARVGKQPADHIELVVAREDLHSFLPAGFLVPGFDNLRVVFDDFSQCPGREEA